MIMLKGFEVHPLNNGMSESFWEGKHFSNDLGREISGSYEKDEQSEAVSSDSLFPKCQVRADESRKKSASR